MPSAADTWDSRYADRSFHPAPQPNPFLLESLPFFPRGRALDLACGAGQNAVFLAERGWQVTAIDVSPVALDRAATLASSRGIHLRRAASPRADRSAPRSPAFFSTGSSKLMLLEADLESFSLPVASFEVILCFRYLQRSLFPAIERALRPGGVLVYETFTTGQLTFGHGPRNPDHLLQPDELRTAFPHLSTLFYREWISCSAVPSREAGGAAISAPAPTSGEALASLLARKPARP